MKRLRPSARTVAAAERKAAGLAAAAATSNVDLGRDVARDLRTAISINEILLAQLRVEANRELAGRSAQAAEAAFEARCPAVEPASAPPELKRPKVPVGYKAHAEFFWRDPAPDSD
jgi:hypothetical protein